MPRRIEKPRFAVTTSPAAAARPPCRSSRFFEKPRTLCRTGSEKAKFATTVSMNGTRASSDHAIDARSVFVSRSSTR